jgi:TIR domain
MLMLMIIVLGDAGRATLLKELIAERLRLFGLQIGSDVEWVENPQDINLDQRSNINIFVLFLGGQNPSVQHLEFLLENRVAILPVVSQFSQVDQEIPEALRFLNCLSWQEDGEIRVASAVLEGLRLLPSQRRIFLSYRRSESRVAAVQLFEVLSARGFDVFLDTHEIPPARDFQEVLWHRFRESDLMLMLDTESYFDSRWTRLEFGRALSKTLPILRIGWPGVNVSDRLGDTVKNITLESEDLNEAGLIMETMVNSVVSMVELLRSEGYADRIKQVSDRISEAVQKVQGRVLGIGKNQVVYVELVNKQKFLLYPILGIPGSQDLYEVAQMKINGVSRKSRAVVYDDVGVKEEYLEHLKWLLKQLKDVRCCPMYQLDWQLPDWED